MGNYHSTPNTLSAEAFGLTTEESKVLTSNVYPEVTFAFTNKTRGVLNGEGKSQTLHKATQGLLLDREGELPEVYKVTDLWVTQDGLTLTEVAEANALATHEVRDKSKSAPWFNDVTYKTVYSNYKTATDVVTADEPTAVGYKAGHAELWADYLAGGPGALNDRQLSKELLDRTGRASAVEQTQRPLQGFVFAKTVVESLSLPRLRGRKPSRLPHGGWQPVCHRSHKLPVRHVRFVGILDLLLSDPYCIIKVRKKGSRQMFYYERKVRQR